MVEFALVSVLLAVLFSAVVDLSLGWRRSIQVSGVLRTSARVLSNLGDERGTDRETLLALNAGIGEIGAANVKRVIIYAADGVNGAVPPACLGVSFNSNGAGLNDTCNVYSPGQLQSGLPATRFDGATCDSNDWDRFYCPTVDREGDQGAPGGPDYVGIWIEVDYTYLVGLLPGNGIVITDDTVMRIEPTL